jgi:hypothetical protein
MIVKDRPTKTSVVGSVELTPYRKDAKLFLKPRKRTNPRITPERASTMASFNTELETSLCRAPSAIRMAMSCRRWAHLPKLLINRAAENNSMMHVIDEHLLDLAANRVRTLSQVTN